MESEEHRQCLFCRITKGAERASLVLQDELSLAFLDHRPLFPGHCLLVPRAHYETLPDLPFPLIAPLFANAGLLARALEEGLGAEGSFIALNNRVSQSVPHLHIHVVPRRRKDGLRGFFWPRQRYPSESAIMEVQEKLVQAIAAIRSR